MSVDSADHDRRTRHRSRSEEWIVIVSRTSFMATTWVGGFTLRRTDARVKSGEYHGGNDKGAAVEGGPSVYSEWYRCRAAGVVVLKLIDNRGH